MRLPPGVSGKDFSAAMEHFEKVVGKDFGSTSDEDVDLYRDPYTPDWHEEEEKIPSAGCGTRKCGRSASGGEDRQSIQDSAVARFDGEENPAYGGTSPALSGTAILDLKRMDRILEVNERNHYALVEPGVSYFDLYRYIQENKLKVWI